MRILLGAMILFVLLFVNCATNGGEGGIESMTVGGDVQVRTQYQCAE